MTPTKELSDAGLLLGQHIGEMAYKKLDSVKDNNKNRRRPVVISGLGGGEYINLPAGTTTANPRPHGANRMGKSAASL